MMSFQEVKPAQAWFDTHNQSLNVVGGLDNDAESRLALMQCYATVSRPEMCWTILEQMEVWWQNQPPDLCLFVRLLSVFEYLCMLQARGVLTSHVTKGCPVALGSETHAGCLALNMIMRACWRNVSKLTLFSPLYISQLLNPIWRFLFLFPYELYFVSIVMSVIHETG
jgi:hypothetical protein